MATRTESTGQPMDTRPDHEYALVAGLYVAALLAPAVLIAVARSLPGPAALYVGVLTASTVIAGVAGLSVLRVPGIAVLLGRYTASWLLAVVPIAWYPGVLGSVELVVDVPAVAGVIALVGATAAILLGLLLTSMSRNRYTAARLVDAVTVTQWEARWPRRWRRTAIAIAIVATVLGLGAIVVGYVYDADAIGQFYALLYVPAVLGGVMASRSFRVTDAGLVHERPLVRRLRPWDSIAGYTLTETTLVVEQTAWWRPAIRSERADIEDAEAVVAALEDRLGQDERA